MKIIISQGDANGIGIETGLKALKRYFEKSTSDDDTEFIFAVNPTVLASYIEKENIRFVELDNGEMIIDGHRIEILALNSSHPVRFGKISPIAGKLAGEAIDTAIAKCLISYADAMVTLPINKEALNLGGYKFTGHTEFLAARCEVKKPLMILSDGKNLNVALVTTHIPVCEIHNYITEENIGNKISHFVRVLMRDMAIAEPKIAVLALNPHAGDDGLIGTEEDRVIIPAMRNSEYAKFLEGPFASDGFFASGKYNSYNGVLAMYHDQGLIPLKMIAGGAGVNITGGLPIIRTSPDHGTGFDIAGRNIADESSVLSAILMAKKIYYNRKK